MPPDDSTRWREPASLGEKTITPSGLQLPPCPRGASASVSAGPPEASIVLSLPLAKNPMYLLSGDQNGNLGFSVPASGCAAREFNGRVHSCILPSADRAPNTRRRPSGEIAGTFTLTLPKSNTVPSGAR